MRHTHILLRATLFAALMLPAFADLIDDRGITVHSAAAITEKRQTLIQYIWGAEGFPMKRLPDVTTNVASPVKQLESVERVDELRIDMAPRLQGLAYHFIPKKPNGGLVVVHHGHACTFDDDPSPADVGYGLQRTIKALLREGYGVLGVFMPHKRPGDCSGGHDAMFQMKTTGSPMKYFLEPTALSLNYLKSRSAADGFPAYRAFMHSGEAADDQSPASVSTKTGKPGSGKTDSSNRWGVPTEESKERFKQALLTGDAGHFATISKPDYLSIEHSSDGYSYAHDVCFANDDKILNCFRALAGGLNNKQTSPAICRTLLYLSPEPLWRADARHLLADVRERISQLVASPDARHDQRVLADLQARYAVSVEQAAKPGAVVSSSPRAILENRKLVQVSGMGENRSTAYTMSNLFYRHKGRLYFTWMDKPLLNCVGMMAPGLPRPVSECVIAQPTDDHGNAAIVKDLQGRIHAIVGAHHGPFLHRMAANPDKPYQWRDVGPLAANATHPCLVCDRKGALHLVYRSSVQNPWLLVYQRFGADGKWSPPKPLVRAGMPWYYTWTNTLAVAPDNTLHLVFADCKRPGGGGQKDQLGDPYWGSAHIYSEDGGETWKQYGNDAILPAPVEVAALATVENASETAKRTLPAAEYDAYKGNPALNKAPTALQMLLSNAVVDDRNRPWVVVHNNLEKSASLYCAEKGKWGIRADLSKAVQQAMPGWVISEQSALSRHRNGFLEAVLMIVPSKGRDPKSFVGWQSLDLQLLRIVFDAEGKVLAGKLVMPANPEKAAWLPNLEKWDWNYPFDHPALLFSHGASEGTYYDSAEKKKEAKRAVVMETWLDMADVSP